MNNYITTQIRYSMVVKKLVDLKIEIIIECFLKSFKNYFVEMPTDINYYKNRWKVSKVDFNLSYGMFDGELLVGFIINAVDDRNGDKIAFNTGTGVLPKYRGNRVVKSIYDYAIPDLIKNGVTKCSLEVITENIKAIKSYQSIGFEICKSLKCYSGDINLTIGENVELNKLSYDTMDWDRLPDQNLYSWDFQKETIKNGDYSYYHVVRDRHPESYFIINPNNKYLAQFGILEDSEGNWNRLFSGIEQISKNVKTINIDDRLIKKIEVINTVGLLNTVNQYEMEMRI